ncbi:MAG TPA: NAD(P)-binding domain-containing protein [Candidatus Krumholzibacteria bacterium]|nr:NAD(P)-binding domain-containing protein [Candidatus Krumholzibacteria bacterium]
MESLGIWAVALLIGAFIVVRYTRGFKRRRREDSERLTMTRELGMDRPMGQYPLIDAGQCIGCGTCVDACPEGDVLGIVQGKAVVINGARCIGHGRCGEACPVGAIKVGLGDVTKRDDIPLLSADNESNVPGLWIAGELSGFALINNAVEQGTRVMRAIADRGRGVVPPGGFDVVVVGAGPAGLSAALVAGELGLSCVVLDQQGAGGTILQYPRRKLVMVQPVEIPTYGRLPKHEYTKEELLDIWTDLHARHGLDVRTGVRVTAVRGVQGNFRVESTAGEFVARHVMLALGRRGTPRRLNVPGEDSAKVAYKLIDAEAYKGRKVLVVGGGDSAVEAAMGLAHQEGCLVTLSYRKPDLMRIKQRNADRITPLIEAGTIDFRGGTTVTAIHPDRVELEGSRGRQVVANDDVFILAGGLPPFALLKDAGVRFGGEQRSPVPV